MTSRLCDICKEIYLVRNPRQLICPKCRIMPLQEFKKKYGMTKNEMLIKNNTE
jgi:hypothetical protein